MARITIVEDDPSVGRLLRRVLSEDDHESVIFTDGLSAFDALIKEPLTGNHNPDMVILDVNLPKLSGFDIARALRQHPERGHIPILMLSAQGDRNSQLRGLDYADDYLTKPFDPDILLARITVLLRRQGERSAPAINRPVDSLVAEMVRHYRIEALIGRGGMGVVYKARDTRLASDVALKFITTGFEDDNHQRRFIREARAANRLENPHICTVYTVDESEEGHLFMVMPYLEGQTLADYLQQYKHYNPPMLLSRVREVILQVADGLAIAHAAEIVHRDVKPSNIFLETSGRVRLLDFGVAKWKVSPEASIAQHVHPDGSSQNLFMGTLLYMSPEQALSNQCDAHSDMWSLGNVLYEMLTGKNPFHREGGGFAGLIHAITQENPAPLQGQAAVFNPIIARMLHKNPLERFASMQVLKEHLQMLELS